jgi:hypothetical protein
MKRKFFLLFIGVVMLSAFGFGALTVTSGTAGARGTLTQIGSTGSWYLRNLNYQAGAYPGNKVYFDIVYTAGDETNVSFTIGYLYGSAAPATANISAFPESDSTGNLSAVTRYILKSGSNQRYTVSVEVPDAASYVVITFSYSGGTPTGTVAAYGYMNSYN